MSKYLLRTPLIPPAGCSHIIALNMYMNTLAYARMHTRTHTGEHEYIPVCVCERERV